MLSRVAAFIVLLTVAGPASAGTDCPADFAGGQPPELDNPKLARDTYL